MPGHHHRAGELKQSNKKNKRRNASKRSVSRKAGGKISQAKATLQRQVQQNKLDRKNRQEQIRNNKRQELLRQRRGGVSAGAFQSPPPRVVGILSLGGNNQVAAVVLEERLRQFLAKDANQVVVSPTPEHGTNVDGNASTITAKYDVHKKDGVLTLLTGSTAFASAPGSNGDRNNGDVQAALDLARIADVVLFVVDGNAPSTQTHGKTAAHDKGTPKDPFLDMHIGMNHNDDGHDNDGDHCSNKTSQTNQQWDHLISERGDAILTALKAQGLPTVVTVLAQTENDELDAQNSAGDHMTMQSVKSLRRSSIKRRLDLKKYATRFATTEFGTAHNKVIEVDLSSVSASQSQSQPGINNNKQEPDAMDDEQPEDLAGARDEEATPTVSTSSAARASPATLIRALCSMSCSPSKWIAQSPRPYIVSESWSYDSASQELDVSGYIRGMAPLNIHSLVHVPTLGTFAPKRITRQMPPLDMQRKQQQQKNNNKLGLDASMLLVNNNNNSNTIEADPEQQESLNMFATPDSLQGEQNLIGFDQDDDDDDDDDDHHSTEMEGQHDGDEEKAIARPAGWSDYQSAWLDAMDNHDEDEMDRGELARELNEKKTHSDAASTVLGGGGDLDLDEANHISQKERQSLLEQRQKEQSVDLEFPDEVQVDETVKASERFARYRALKSFRKSVWDPKENLPESYATLYHFSNFKATQRSVMKDAKEAMRAAEAAQGQFFGKSPPVNLAQEGGSAGADADVNMANHSDHDDDDFDPLEGCVPSGTYVTLKLGGVSPEGVQSICQNTLLTAVSLLEYENKVSVLHAALSQSSAKMVPSDRVPIKSKDVLTFRCGWRTWQARPVFSQNNLNCDKHKFERFLPAGGAYFCGSLFGPVTYTPCPVLVFKTVGDKQQLVAAGTMMNADADRIVVKRIILTGYPVRVHKRHATVKYMFYNPDDVKWFQPAELYSKHGLRGNIIQSVGEHGTMKCLFNAPIKQHDTVCLPLYKRIYPKYVVSKQENGTDVPVGLVVK